MTTPYQLLQRALHDGGARPFVTFFDDATGERVELSVATFDNWVAKTANLLQDGLAVEPGDRVGIAMPLHWQVPALYLACWAVGAVAVPGGGDGLTAAFVAEERLGSIEAPELLALSLGPLGAPMREVPRGVADYAVEVPSYADRFAALTPPTEQDPALEVAGELLTLGDLVARAEGVYPPGARVLTTLAYDSVDALIRGLVAPLAAGGSVVLVRNPDPATAEARRTTQRVTHDVH